MSELSPYFVRRSVAQLPGQPQVYSDPQAEEGTESAFRDVWRVIRKRRRLILAAFLTTMIIVGLNTLMSTPIYTSEATLLIEEKAPQLLDIKQVLSDTLVGSSLGRDYYETQFEILRSMTLASQVIREQGLASNKYFTEESRKRTGLLTFLKTTAKQWLRPNEPMVSEAVISQRRLADRYINEFLEIKQVKNTRLVRVAFNTPDPLLSAQLANAHSLAYLRHNLTFRDQANKKAEEFLDQKLVELRKRLEKSEMALGGYRRQKGIVSLDEKENVVVDRLADLNRRLTEAEAQRIALQSQMQLVRDRAFDSLPEVIGNGLIQGLKQQLAKLEGDHANMSAEYNPAYPRMAQLKAQLDETRRRLDAEVKTVVAGIESGFLAAVNREKDLRSKFADQRGAVLELKDASVEYALLAREADTNRQLHDSVLKRRNEMAVTSGVGSSNINLVDEAMPALGPSRPRIARNLFFGLLLGVVGSLALAFFFEYLNKTVRNAEEVERYYHLSTLGMVPDFAIAGISRQSVVLDAAAAATTIGGSAQRNGSAHRHAPLSLVGESYRFLQTSILLTQAEDPPRVVLFTSGLGGEGKTSTAINTAIVFAQMETRVLVIDADLRRASCHEHLLQQREPGLTEVLNGERSVESVIKRTLTDNLYVITGGAACADPAKLVGSHRMHELISSLRDQFDYVFIDSPPLIPVSDAVRLSTMADGVVLIVEAEKTPREALRRACLRLHCAQAKILGVVMNKVDMKAPEYQHHRGYYAAATTPAPV